VSGSSGTIRITTNGGTSWSPQTIATTATLYRIHFTDLQNGWVSGTLGSLFRTTNGGATWERVTRIVSSAKTLYDFDLTANALHAVGTDATIVYANLGPVSVDDTRELLPTQASLLQNYPNPFNPVTNFQFSIANSQLTILKVYDLLGREAVTLVNEVKQPGSYEVTWDAAGYSSGVYFSRLRVGEFTAVRKLLLLR
jgi:hypothetical protein